MDKFAFTFGVVIIVATAMIVGRAPTFLPSWYMGITLSVSCVVGVNLRCIVIVFEIFHVSFTELSLFYA